jgi:hypothetical protein
MKAEAREAAKERRERAQLDRKMRSRMMERIADIKRKRLQDARGGRTRSVATRRASPVYMQLYARLVDYASLVAESWRIHKQ